LPRNAAIPIATKLTATLVKYPRGNDTTLPVLFDPATKELHYSTLSLQAKGDHI